MDLLKEKILKASRERLCQLKFTYKSAYNDFKEALEEFQKLCNHDNYVIAIKHNKYFDDCKYTLCKDCGLEYTTSMLVENSLSNKYGNYIDFSDYEEIIKTVGWR